MHAKSHVTQCQPTFFCFLMYQDSHDNHPPSLLLWWNNQISMASKKWVWGVVLTTW